MKIPDCPVLTLIARSTCQLLNKEETELEQTQSASPSIANGSPAYLLAALEPCHKMLQRSLCLTPNTGKLFSFGTLPVIKLSKYFFRVISSFFGLSIY